MTRLEKIEIILWDMPRQKVTGGILTNPHSKSFEISWDT